MLQVRKRRWWLGRNVCRVSGDGNELDECFLNYTGRFPLAWTFRFVYLTVYYIM